MKYEYKKVPCLYNEDRIEKLMEEYPGLTISVQMDQGDYINLIVKSVLQSMVLGSILAIIISVVFVFASLVTCLTCKEQIVTPKAEKTSVKGMIDVLFKNDQVKVVLGIALFFNIAYQLSNSFALYYFKYVAERTYNIEGNGVLCR